MRPSGYMDQGGARKPQVKTSIDTSVSMTEDCKAATVLLQPQTFSRMTAP